jgi:hypothetical protein
VNCPEVQSRLSAYHDGELSTDVAAQVAAHLADCSSCAAELASFVRLSQLSRRLTDPPVPSQIWTDLETRLQGSSQGRTAILARLVPKRAPAKYVAIAASILVAAGIGLIAYRAWSPAIGHNHLANNFSNFVDTFNKRPDDAQQILLANYHGRPTTLPEATAALGYEPVAAKRLPPGSSIEKVFLLKMPCCTCAQVVCRTEDGNSVAIFEHDVDQPVWFGRRPSVKCDCHNRPTSVVQVGDKLAATWKNGERYVTIVGARDLEELTEFVAHLSDSDAGRG